MVPAPKVPKHPFKEDPGPNNGDWLEVPPCPEFPPMAEVDAKNGTEPTAEIQLEETKNGNDAAPAPSALAAGQMSETSRSGTMQSEALSATDFRRERIKSAIGVFLVLLHFLAAFLVCYLGGLDFDEPVCSLKNSLGLEMIVFEEEPSSCERCGSGTLFLPLAGEYEKSWSKGLRACLYFVGLLWIFLGIGIVCDQFMAGIEEITSKERTYMVEGKEGARHKFSVKVWNGTVANLTLMALGSSAPEILLNVIEITSGSFFRR